MGRVNTTFRKNPRVTQTPALHKQPETRTQHSGKTTRNANTAFRKRGFMRIIEVVLALILMFALMTALIQQNPAVPQARKNTRIMNRYAEDLKNMVCNSERDRTLALAGDLDAINESLDYVLPYDIKFRVAVLDSGDSELWSTGYALPDLVNSPTDVSSTGCAIRNETTPTRRLLVQVWY